MRGLSPWPAQKRRGNGKEGRCLTGKEKRRAALRIALFLLFLLAVVRLLSFVTERKESGSRLRPFLRNAKQYDVLFFGDSHVINGAFPRELWRDWGIPAYNLASYGNTMPVVYWTMRLALQYASPQWVVIGVKGVEKDWMLTGSSSDLHTALDGYPLSPEKLTAILDLTKDPRSTDDEGNPYQQLRWEYLFKLAKYHSRWRELTGNDFAPGDNRLLGALNAVSVAVPAEYAPPEEPEPAEESGVGYEYLRRMIAECRERGIRVLLVNMPYPAKEEAWEIGERVRLIAEETDTPFIDFLRLDSVADYQTDCYDPRSHLNPSGARKVTAYLGDWLRRRAALPDRRGDPAYARFQEEDAIWLSDKEELLRGQTQPDRLLMLLHDPDFSVAFHMSEWAAFGEDDRLLRLLENISRAPVLEADAEESWSDALWPLSRLNDAAWEGLPYFCLAAQGDKNPAERIGEEIPGTYDTPSGALSVSETEKGAIFRLARGGKETAYLDGEPAGPYGVSFLIFNRRTGGVVRAGRM